MCSCLVPLFYNLLTLPRNQEHIYKLHATDSADNLILVNLLIYLYT